MSGTQPRLRITEMSNELTDRLDELSPEEIVRVLRQTDQQLFVGWRGNSCVFDMADTMEKLACSTSPHSQSSLRPHMYRASAFFAIPFVTENTLTTWVDYTSDRGRPHRGDRATWRAKHICIQRLRYERESGVALRASV